VASNHQRHGGDILRAMLKSWGILVMLLFLFIAGNGFHTDPNTDLSKMIEQSDYTTTFYVSGKLILAGRLSDIYPPPDCPQLSGARYDVLSHQILPNLPPGKSAICPYFPIVPLIFSPLTGLTPMSAYLAWQCLSLAALAVSAILIDRLVGTRLAGTYWLSLLFLPVVHCLFVGQSALLLGVLPLTLGYYFFHKEKYFWAGAAWAVTFLKPQFLIVPVFMCAAAFLRPGQPRQEEEPAASHNATSSAGKIPRHYRALTGFAAGLTVLLIANLIIFGARSYTLWLGGMQVVERVYSNAANGVMKQIVASMPRILILYTPVEMQSVVKPALALVCALLVIGALFAVSKLARTTITQADYADSCLLMALSLVPLAAPYLFYYDLSVFVLAWAAMAKAEPKLKLTLGLMALAINLGGVFLSVPFAICQLIAPWLLLLIYLEVYRRLLVRMLRRSS
jgi:hypothetical protein